MDIAPQFAGVLMGISNCIACLSGIIGPLIVGIITEDVSTGSDDVMSLCEIV